MNRFDDITSKFEYAEMLRQELMNLLFNAKRDEVETKPIMHHARTILAESRECFDYCAQDIFEAFILPNTKEQKILDNHKNDKLRLYFPFYELQLTQGVFLELEKFEPNLYKHLIDLTQKVQANDPITNTLYKYGSVLELKDMVNEKKHDKLLAVKSDPQQEVLVENAGFKAIFPVKQNTHLHTLHVPADSTIKLVDEFLFEYNDCEVSDFCMTAVFVTRIVLDEIYKQFFGKGFIKIT